VLKVVEKFVFNCEEEIFNWISGGKASERRIERERERESLGNPIMAQKQLLLHPQRHRRTREREEEASSL
jgi:hypothetical protein